MKTGKNREGNAGGYAMDFTSGSVPKKDVIAGFTPFVIGVIYYRTGKWKRNYVSP